MGTRHVRGGASRAAGPRPFAPARPSPGRGVAATRAGQVEGRAARPAGLAGAAKRPIASGRGPLGSLDREAAERGAGGGLVPRNPDEEPAAGGPMAARLPAWGGP